MMTLDDLARLDAAIHRPARLEALAATGLLDSPTDEAFDRITRLCARLLRVPVSLVSLVDCNRQFFKSASGLAEPLATRRETPLSLSFCQYVTARSDALLVEDARTDPILAQHPAVRDASLGVVAYAGVPVVYRGEPIGALCVVDGQPRHWSAEDLVMLEDLAALVTNQIEREAGRIELERAIERLTEADRRKNEFLATLAHELRNPVAPIRTAVHVLKQVDGESALARQSIAIIERQIKVMQRLIDDLLDVNRIERDTLKLDRRRVLLDEVLDAAVEPVQGQIEERGLTLIQQRPDRPAWLDADPVRLSQAVVNLLGNAAKFTPPGGRITLAARFVDDLLEIEVSDTGIGFDPDSSEQIFELFTQTQVDARQTPGGLGIGLALARRLMALHGGTIEAWSAGVGRGARFTLRLPARQREDETPAG